ncbi:MAG: transporter substrate-binding domain-containing protein [Bacteroidaceae bacterium]|nr:transporter substrate-binding domain-containing protein [Bacteroidaceae bacterium]
MRTLKYIFFISVVVGFTVYAIIDIFFPNGFFGDDEEDNKPKKTALNIGAPNSISSLPVWVAEEDSIFDSLQVDITVKHFTDQLDCDMAFVKGKINLSISDQERVEWMKKKYDVKYNELRRLPYPYSIVANRKARITKFTQLKDKMLAVTRHSTYAKAAQHCIDSVKMKSDSVYIVQINNPNVALLMLQNNEMDASFLPEPYVIMAKKMGHNTIFTSFTEALLIGNTENKSDDMRKFNLAYDEALKRIRKNGLKHYTELIARRCKCQTDFEGELKVKF